jgi:hypothetical protein
LVAPLVDDESDYGSWARHLYGLSPDERAAHLRREENELESRKLYAVQIERGPDASELAGLLILQKEYSEYLRRQANSEHRVEAIVSIEILHRLVRSQFEYRPRPGEYPTVDRTANVIGECWRFGDITWSTWRDYAVNPHAARTILHKRRVPGVEGMSDLQLIRKLEEVIAEETSKLEEEQAAEAQAREAKAYRARGARRTRKIMDWFSSATTLDHSVVEIARAARLPQRRVRALLLDQGCPGVTVAAGDPPRAWFDSDAGREFKAALTAAIEERRRSKSA